MNRMTRVVNKLTTNTDDAQDAWIRLVSHATSGLLILLWILTGLLHGPFNLKDWVHVLQFWTGVVFFPLLMFLLIVDIKVLRNVRRRELEAENH